MKNLLLIPNATSLMQSMRSIGYNFSSAAADIIDNSIYAKATDIEIFYQSKPDDTHFAILDNGTGMDEKELVNAMKYGAKSPTIKREKEDLGRFGIGLKSASLSQCRQLTVITKKNDILNAASWDLDYVIEKDKWIILRYSEEEIMNMEIDYVADLNKKDSGTLVYWKDFDRLSSPKDSIERILRKKIEMLENHLALVFHRYLEDNKNGINIYINDNKIKPVDPFLRSNFATQTKPVQTKNIRGDHVKITPYVLPHMNKMTNKEIASLGGKETLKASQGYYVYRNRRLIIGGKWFNQYPKHELAKLVRVQVDIPNSLDDLWEIDIKKSQAVLPHVIRKNLGMMINEALNDGKDVFRYRGKRKNRSTEFLPVWNRIEDREYIRYEVNKDHELIREYISKLNNIKVINALLSFIENNIPSESIYIDKAEDKKTNAIIDKSKLEHIFNKFSVLEKDTALKILDSIMKNEGLDLNNNEKKQLRRMIEDAK